LSCGTVAIIAPILDKYSFAHREAYYLYARGLSMQMIAETLGYKRRYTYEIIQRINNDIKTAHCNDI
jgi:transposase-like protein